jgi:hypothetical protein
MPRLQANGEVIRVENNYACAMSESRDATAIDNLEDTSFDFDGGVGRLIE